MRRRRRRRAKGYLSSPKACTPSPGPTKPPIQWVPGFICMEIKRPGRESDKSVPSSAEFKNERNSKPPPSMCLNGMYRENFIFVPLFFDTVVFFLNIVHIKQLSWCYQAAAFWIDGADCLRYSSSQPSDCPSNFVEDTENVTFCCSLCRHMPEVCL